MRDDRRKITIILQEGAYEVLLARTLEASKKAGRTIPMSTHAGTLLMDALCAPPPAATKGPRRA